MSDDRSLFDQIHNERTGTAPTGRERLLNARITDLVNRVTAVEAELRTAMKLIAQLQGDK